MELTDWISGARRPVRPGWYQVRGVFAEGLYAMRYWSGKRWMWVSPTYGFVGASVGRNDDWRGVLKGN